MKAYERLLKYVTFDTQSDPDSETSPSASKEFHLLEELKKEEEAMGFSPVLTNTGYLYACLKGNTPAMPVGFISHVDTAQGASGANVTPHIIQNWDGNDIQLDEDHVISLRNFPEMVAFKGKDLMVTNGKTLLGADDKAGVAEIMTMLETLLAHPEIPHGDVWFAFTPDEEIGRGTEHFELEHFPAKFAYTVDGGTIGGVEYENFNAASAHVTFTGVAIHPGSAKNKMINAADLACEFNQLLPQQERPQYTEGREGFFMLENMKGDVANATLDYIIRDHDADHFALRKKLIRQTADFINEKYGRKVCEVEAKDSYYNMVSCFAGKEYVIDIALQATRDAGITPESVPIRGGTDGASLTYMGLPCPNLGTGCGNFHGPFEYACLQDMDKAVEILLHIVQRTAERGL